MSKSAATRARPLSPHLFIYKPIPTMVMSIVHRITGVALYFGTLLVAGWLIAASTSAEWFEQLRWIYGSWIGLLILLGFTWAMFHHTLGGVRHLIWDTGHGMEKRTSTLFAWATLAGSITLTVIFWAALFLIRI